ncbi:unnamed protein product [Caenorhabditis angaria]|uniref:Uncharacterized protein n=1 Tax=Caenorhabditis angaria TaxID=860376 RepID=A0A9P1J6C5_9PELO|nr:unnamed protein product [Caenorhabditis angaria]
MSVNSSSEASSLSDFEIIDWPVREENEYIPEPPIREDRIVPLEVTPSPFRPTPRDPRIRRTPNPEPVRYPYFRNAPRDVTPYDNPEIIDIDSRPGNADFMRHLSSTGRDRFYRPPPQPMLPRISITTLHHLELRGTRSHRLSSTILFKLIPLKVKLNRVKINKISKLCEKITYLLLPLPFL